MGRVLLLLAIGCVACAARAQVSLEPVGRYETGIFNASAAEILAYEPKTRRVFVTNAAANAIDVVSIADPTNPVLVRSIQLASFGGGVNSVALRDDLVAVAVEARVKQDPGVVVFFDADGVALHEITVGALPDSLLFSPDGRYLLVANEGEPNDDYTIDPAGSVSVISVPLDRRELASARVRTASFQRFDLIGVPEGVRVFGPGATPSRDLEPEYIAFSADSRTAYVSCQENNAMAVIDVENAQVASLVPLGLKDHSRPNQGLDASDRDGSIRIRTYPVFGMYQPDTIASYEVDGRTFVVTANEGDVRDYAGTPGFKDEARVADLTLDPGVFPDAKDLQRPERLGRLKVSAPDADTDGDGDADRLWAFGARSISIWDDACRLVWDSGDLMEQIVGDARSKAFNANNDDNDSFDTRSDDRGPEPEALAIGRLGRSVYAFCGLERAGGVMVFDITDPVRSRPVGYFTTRVLAGDVSKGAGGDVAPECLHFIDAADSPTGEPLLVAAHEVSGTVVVFRVHSD